VSWPLHGEDVAVWLVDLLETGVSFDEIKAAAAAIEEEYDRQGCYLDGRPIKLALKMIAEQTTPGRILN
jgi:hypothetical protein